MNLWEVATVIYVFFGILTGIIAIRVDRVATVLVYATLSAMSLSIAVAFILAHSYS